jgi:RNA polymerase sigma-70 factor, ECF subfamily
MREVTIPIAIDSGIFARESRPPPPDAPFAGALGAFEDVYDEHFEFVWRSVRRLGVPEAAVDDAVQDVFVVVHRRGHEFEGRSSVRTWLFGIVVHVARAYRRKRTPEPAADPDTLEDSARRGPQAQAEAREAMRLLYEVLDTLDDDKREVLVLIDIEEMTAPEAAEVLSLKLNTVYTRLRTARRDFDAEVARRAARDVWRLR